MSTEIEAGSLHAVGSLAALRATGRLKATIGDRLIAVFAVGDRVVATNGRCPHNRGPLHQGDIDIGCNKVACPWHGYTFDLDTGACEEDPDLVLERFEVQLNDDDILVRL